MWNAKLIQCFLALMKDAFKTFKNSKASNMTLGY